MAVKLAYNGIPQFFDANGDPLSGGKLFHYAAGSTTKQTAYQDSAGSTPHANPIVLDSSGRPSAEIWFTAGLNYKEVLSPSTDSDPPTSPLWTADNLAGINDTTSAIDEWIASGLTPTFISATSFSFTGDQTTIFANGRKVKSSVTAGTTYSEIVNSSFGGGITTITLKNESGTIDSGLSAVSYGLTSPAHPSAAQSTANAQPVCNGRLTLATATPVTTSDVTAATTVFFTPYKGNTVDLYDGTANWIRYTFSELSLVVPSTTSTMYDVFLQNNAGTLQLNAVAWTNDTTRATALATQNGVLVKTGALGQLYLGSFRTTGSSGQTEDSLAKRYVWNYYNRVDRAMKVIDSTDTWTYTTATFRQANNNGANQLDMVIGVSEDAVYAEVTSSSANTAANTEAAAGIGLDATNASSATLADYSLHQISNLPISHRCSYFGLPGVGRHFLAWLEYSQASGTTTWVGDNGVSGRQQSGMAGRIRA